MLARWDGAPAAPMARRCSRSARSSNSRADPARSPRRRAHDVEHLPEEHWPSADRAAFEAAFHHGDPFDETAGAHCNGKPQEHSQWLWPLARLPEPASPARPADAASQSHHARARPRLSRRNSAKTMRPSSSRPRFITSITRRVSSPTAGIGVGSPTSRGASSPKPSRVTALSGWRRRHRRSTTGSN